MNIMQLLREEKESIVGPPLDGELKVNSNFGMRKGRMHWGVDLRASSGTEIIAPESGEITQTNIIPRCGGVMVIKHDNGSQSRFCHVKEFILSKGAKVKKGDVVGLTGGGKNDIGKGNALGPHLHYELKIPPSGSLVNPMDYINKNYKRKYSEERKVLSGMKRFYKKNTILKYDESKVNEFNQDIWDLQFVLQFLGFYTDKIDGKFTPLTRKAIGKFQKSIGNKRTGNYKSNEVKSLFEQLKQNSFITKGHTPIIGTNDLKQKYEIKEKYDIILISGIEKYESVSEQTNRLESGGKRAFGIFHKNSRTEFPKVIKENPNAYVIFYSKGCEYAELALLKDENGTPLVKDKSKVYIIEPYMRPSESVSAINGGVPIKNVYVGSGESSGKGLFSGAKERPEGYNHKTILTYIGKILR